MRVVIPSLLFLVLSINIALGNTIHVPDDSTTIQGAINGSADGDTIIVRSGTYFENINFLGKAIFVVSDGGPNVTTIDGGSPVNPDSGSVVTFVNGEDSSSVLEGFTVTNGNGNRDHSFRYGGGIYCEDSSPEITGNVIRDNTATYGSGVYCRNSSPLISGNSILDNTQTFSGSGIYCTGSSPTITDNVISGNRPGGGIYLSSSSPVISNNNITDNNNSNYGGGIGAFLSSPTIVDNSITLNSADGGGGIYCDSSSPIISNNIIVENEAEVAGSNGGGGGILCKDGSQPDISNNVISGNWTIGSGGGIRCSNALPTVTNTILWGNDSPSGPEMSVENSSVCTVSYSDIAYGQDSVYVGSGGTLNWGDGMIDADPVFADPEYHLQLTSPCIDAGDPMILDACLPPGSGTDRSDMGAHGGEENCGWPLDLLEVVIDPAGPVTVPKGDTLHFSTLIRNNGGTAAAGNYWLNVLLPSSNEILIPANLLNLDNPLSGEVPPADSVFFYNDLFIPTGVDAGSYRVIGRVGVYPNLSLDEWWLDIQVTE